MYPLNPEDFMIDDNRMEEDYDCMHRLHPAPSRQIAEFIEDICDRQEYEGSFLYDESPDKTTILALTDQIHDQIGPMDPPSWKDVIQTLLCDEILFRRFRHHHKKKLFQNRKD